MLSSTSLVSTVIGRSRRLAVTLAAGVVVGGGLLLTPGVAAANPAGVDCVASLSAPVKTSSGVTVTMTETCPYVVQQIQVQAGVSRNRGTGTSMTSTYYNVRSGQASVTVPCQTGDYQNFGGDFVIYPVGHLPKMYSEVYPNGGVVHIVC